MGPAGTDSHPPPGPRAGRFPVLLRRGLQQECDGGLRRTGHARGGLRLLPYGQVASTGSLVQPVQWSAELHDEEPALVYYNYRFYNPRDGRWINRDPIAEEGGWNLYGFVDNEVVFSIDYLGKETNEFGYTMTIPAGYIPILLIIEGSISIEKKKNCVCIEAKLRTDVGIGVGIGLKIKQKWWPILPDIEYSLKTMISGLSNEKNT